MIPPSISSTIITIIILAIIKAMKAAAVCKAGRCTWVSGPVIVGAGPSGLAVAACLKERGVPSLVLERSHCIASLWQLKTYDRLRLHLPKQYCELPLMAFPSCFPTYPTKEEFVAYLEAYARQFDIRPVFNHTVVGAEYDERIGLWRVRTVAAEDEGAEYHSPWLVVATGENAEVVVPTIDGMEDFKGPIMHTSLYKSGDIFEGKKVLVVGCGNSGMEVSLDLCNHNARPDIVVRDSVNHHFLSPSFPCHPSVTHLQNLATHRSYSTSSFFAMGVSFMRK